MRRPFCSGIQDDGRQRNLSRSIVLLTILTVAVTGSSCTTHKKLTRRGTTGFQQRGIASWYGPGFHGKMTANGEVYDMEALTAAHKQLPFNTVVEVRNHDNGRTVRVRINDRGPFVRGRIIDLSRAAAESIGLIRAGTAKVTLEVVSAPTAPASRRASVWSVQAGAFRDRKSAERHLERILRLEPRARLVDDGDWARVVIGPFRHQKEARRAAAGLEREGIEVLVRHSN